MTHEKLIENLEKAQDLLKAEGYVIHSCVAKYGPGPGVQFSTRVSVPDFDPGTGMTVDHAFADAVRELSINWHNATHKTKIAW